jgi:3-deoxy-manno-octulosonate cytidylyltransferase (CMP-KDO synthetase)
MNSNVLILIPARMASLRLPGKPLADIGGVPMIVHVMRRAQDAAVGPVAVATDSPEIAAAVTAAGGRAVMTRSDHTNGSERISEAVAALDPEHHAEIVVNVQGDFPTLQGEDVGLALGPLADPAVDISTLALEITEEAERNDPNVVKAICSAVSPGRFRALYFTRATAPTGDGPLWSVSLRCHPRRWKSRSGWSNCARSKPGCASTSQSPGTRSSASTCRSIWKKRARC